jgi:hypothetical protein
MTTGAGVAIRPLEAADAPACFEVVRSLLDHFGDRDGQRECAEAVRTAAGLVAVRDGQVVGFLTVVHNGHPGLCRSVGLVPARELPDLWPGNKALLLAMPLAAPRSRASP